MFSKSQKKEKDTAVEIIAQKSVAARPERSDVPTIIASDLKIVGNLISSGAIEVEGDVEGHITCENVTIRKSGRVQGDVIAQTVQVDGEINGLIKGRNVTVSSGGRVYGMVVYESLSVQDGAAIDGQCKYVASIQEIVAIEGGAGVESVLKQFEPTTAYSNGRANGHASAHESAANATAA